jgi:hypothetical protein
MEAEFMSDALDDLLADETEQAALAAADPLAPFDAMLAGFGFNAAVMREQNPADYLSLGQAFFRGMRSGTEIAAYKPVPGARNALRHSLHRAGVL